MVTILDYGLGNIQAFLNIYKDLEIPAKIASTPEQLIGSNKIILPGVGAFDSAMERLNASGMRPALERFVFEQETPILGVCVGMQMLANSSEEGVFPGLGWIDGSVHKFDISGFDRKTYFPHMGWNNILVRRDSPLFMDLVHPEFYFLHSYYFLPSLASQVLAITKHGAEFVSAVSSGHIYGVQFHPEKSHQWGIKLLKNFAEI